MRLVGIDQVQNLVALFARPPTTFLRPQSHVLRHALQFAAPPQLTRNAELYAA